MIALDTIIKNEPEEGYIGCFSGGKDSVVLKALADLAGVTVEWHYHKTTIDPPELVHFIKKHHPDVIFDRPKFGNFFNRMVSKGFPTRRSRWCCKEYKERHFPGRSILMGIRSEESVSRSKRYGLVSSWRKNEIIVCPIYYWPTDYLWRFIFDNSIPYCCLYDEGFKRLGCVGCPMGRSTNRKKEFLRWPKFEQKWKRAFEKIWKKRAYTVQKNGKPWFGSHFFEDWESMWKWWLYDKPLPDPKQLKLSVMYQQKKGEQA